MDFSVDICLKLHTKAQIFAIDRLPPRRATKRKAHAYYGITSRETGTLVMMTATAATFHITPGIMCRSNQRSTPHRVPHAQPPRGAQRWVCHGEGVRSGSGGGRRMLGRGRWEVNSLREYGEKTDPRRRQEGQTLTPPSAMLQGQGWIVLVS